MNNSDIIKIIKKIIILIISSTVIYYSLFIYISKSKIRPDTTIFYNDYRDYINKKADADIIIIGNSKAISSLSSSVIYSKLNKKTYNMAYRAANIEFTKDLLNSYLDNALQKPSMCILEVSWFSFSIYRTSYPYDKPQLEFTHTGWKNFYNSIIAQRSSLIKRTIIELINEKYIYVDWWDGDPKNGQPVFDPHTFRIEDMLKTYPNMEAGIDTKLLKCFMDIIKICKNNNIELVLYTAPEAPIYTLNQKDKNAVKNLIKNSAKNNNIKYLDFTVDGQYYLKEFDSMLYNSHHIRKTNEFTKYFIEALIHET